MKHRLSQVDGTNDSEEEIMEDIVTLEMQDNGIAKIKINYSSPHWIEPFATGKIRQNIKFADFWCVFLTKIKVDPES